MKGKGTRGVWTERANDEWPIFDRAEIYDARWAGLTVMEGTCVCLWGKKHCRN